MTEQVKTWVEALLAEVQEFDFKMFPPTGKIKKGETVLGSCPENAKPLFSLAQYYLRECQRIKLEAEYQPGGMSKDDQVRFKQMDQKNDALMELFWGMVYDGLGIWGTRGIGVREEWKIIETKADNPLQMLAGILGTG
jgi:hypothetical protein